MKLRNVLLSSLLIAAAAAHAETKTYTVDPRHTFPMFEVSHYGLSTQRGRFTAVRGTITLDTQARSGTIDITIDAKSIDMGFAEWNEQMQAEGFFDTARHPEISYRSNKLEFSGGRPVRAQGTLTLLGVSHPLTLEIDSFHCDKNRVSGKPTCGADARTELQRSQFGMTRSLPGIGDDITLVIAIEAVEQEPAG
ncbi:YceI family protein [Steroidobacter cummioxidans]|uniref:YceI family protein n=1 Tax=Steroidobacter cummioxidans TaxID=1803913 RepID=UPI00137ACEF8|nr:YceI family protein [Steroidobacter cummioxidans]